MSINWKIRIQSLDFWTKYEYIRWKESGGSAFACPQRNTAGFHSAGVKGERKL